MTNWLRNGSAAGRYGSAMMMMSAPCPDRKEVGECCRRPIAFGFRQRFEHSNAEDNDVRFGCGLDCRHAASDNSEYEFGRRQFQHDRHRGHQFEPS